MPACSPESFSVVNLAPGAMSAVGVFNQGQIIELLGQNYGGQNLHVSGLQELSFLAGAIEGVGRRRIVKPNDSIEWRH